MKKNHLFRFIGTILLVLSILLVVSCKQEKEKPAEITPEQGQEVIEIGTNIVDSVDLRSMKIDATGSLTLDANLKVQNGNSEYFEIKDAHIDTSVVEYKVKKTQKDGTTKETTEPNIGKTTASATIKGKDSTDPTKTVEFAIAASLEPKEVEGVTRTTGTITIGEGKDAIVADVEEEEPGDEFIKSVFAQKHLDTTGIFDEDLDLNEDLLKSCGEGNVSANLKDVGLVFSGTAEDGTAYSAALTLSGKIEVEAEAPKAGKRAASIDSDIDFTIKISYGGSNSEFTMKFQEKKSTNDLDELIDSIEKAFDDDLTLEGAKVLMAEIGLTTSPRYATINGVEVEATSYLNFLIDFAIQASNSEEEESQD